METATLESVRAAPQTGISAAKMRLPGDGQQCPPAILAATKAPSPSDVASTTEGLTGMSFSQTRLRSRAS